MLNEVSYNKNLGHLEKGNKKVLTDFSDTKIDAGLLLTKVGGRVLPCTEGQIPLGVSTTQSIKVGDGYLTSYQKGVALQVKLADATFPDDGTTVYGVDGGLVGATPTDPAVAVKFTVQRSITTPDGVKAVIVEVL